jgi:UDP-N-acetylmuramoylalanine--D-glutamate ligase
MGSSSRPGREMKVGVLGMGVSGLAALRLAKKNQLDVYAINSGELETWKNKDKVLEVIDVSKCLDEQQAESFEFDELILSPGIPKTHPVAQNSKIVTSETEFASRYIDVPMLAITGTNGKTSTCTLLAEALKLNGKKVFLGGNIGVALSELPLSGESFDYAVVELSSFQLESVDTFHPKVSVILNLSMSHGERYEALSDYAAAKFQITKGLKNEDTFIYHRDIPFLDEWLPVLDCKKIELSNKDFEKFNEKKLAVGKHYNELYAFLDAILKTIGEPTECLKTLMNDFSGLEHRIEFVTEKKGVKFYNDSKSTNLASTLNAIDSFDEPVQLILGGKLRDKKMNLDELIKRKKFLKKVHLVGESKEALSLALNGKLDIEVHEYLGSAILSSEPGVVLFSPAFPSFDEYNNYAHRGESFKEFVQFRFN